jgi:hypothetical protein
MIYLKKSSQKVKEKKRLQVLIHIKSKVTPTSHCQIFRCTKCEIVISTCIILELPHFRIDIIIRGIYIITQLPIRELVQLGTEM